MTERNFTIPLAVLLRQASILHRALTDDAYAAPMAERLNEQKDTAKSNFATRFKEKLDQLGTGSLDHAGKRGILGSLTQEQAAALKEVVRLSALARRTAKITFKGQTVKLHAEFQVGVHAPKTLSALLERSRIILSSCKRYAAELRAKAWIARDTDLLEAAIDAFDALYRAQGEARSERSGISGAKIRFANEVYTDTLKIQNAATLQYPANESGNETARARFLLDEYPPRSRSESAVPAPSPAPPEPAPVTISDLTEPFIPPVLPGAQESGIQDGAESADLPKNGHKESTRALGRPPMP